LEFQQICIKSIFLGNNRCSFRLLIEDRDEIESFQAYLKVFDPIGLQFLQLWLTLRGYEKEYHRRRGELGSGQVAENGLSIFIKWNIKCAKALIDKYFQHEHLRKNVATQVQNFQAEVEFHISQSKTTPSMENVEKLKITLISLLMVLQSLLEVVQFKAFSDYNQSIKSAKYLPKLPENEVRGTRV